MQQIPLKEPDPGWLSQYYSKLQGESEFSHQRRDTVTNWALTLFLAVLATYAASLTSQIALPSFWKIAILLAGLGLLVRFFAMGMISYAFLRRWRYLENRLEQHWAYDDPSLGQLLEDIKKYDHGRRTTTS